MKVASTSTYLRNNGRILIALSFLFALLFSTFALIRKVRESTRSLRPSTNTFINSPSPEGIRILIGILTLPEQHQKRHFLRMIYGQPQHEGNKVDIKFVLCNLTKEEHKVIVTLEMMSYDDIIILDCKENMNEGKTYTYFSSLPKIFGTTDGPRPPYHYVIKADDNTYIRLDNLLKSLRPLPREDLYYGFVIPDPTLDPFTHYMSGMGYLVSWDLVEWIAKSDVPKSHLRGPEDKVFGEWLRNGHQAKNRFSVKWSMYNYPEPQTRYSHALWPDTIAVHKLKTQERWIRTSQYFNVTKNLKPSRLYHTP